MRIERARRQPAKRRAGDSKAFSSRKATLQKGRLTNRYSVGSAVRETTEAGSSAENAELPYRKINNEILKGGR